ncbi:MAG: radical SAM protein [Candidatus Zixiibacteriota bacterium]
MIRKKRYAFSQIREKILSEEKGSIYKRSFQHRFALGFPNTYEVGMSNLGFQTIYKLFNQREEIFCERFFLFDYDPQKGVRTLESNLPLRNFSVIGFSVPFELDYLNVLKLLKLSGIPLKSSERDEKYPLVIGGGVALTLNPETMADFFDLVFIGEAESTLDQFIQTYLRCFNSKLTKKEILLELTKVEGVYVPQFYTPIYRKDGWLKDILPQKDVPQRIKTKRTDLNVSQTFSVIVTPHTHFKDSFLVEVGRGCRRGCRFCAAGFVYRPYRFHTSQSIIGQAEEYSKEMKNIGLVGSLISDLPDLEKITFELYRRGFKVGISSFRADKVSHRLLEILVNSGLKSLTIAPEVATPRMWRVINKGINREDVLECTRIASEFDLSNLKLYFIIGLPFEKREDMEAIPVLIKEMRSIYFKKGQKRKKITLSVNPFVPKAHTPFQWFPMNKESELKSKLKIISDGVKNLRGVQLDKKSIRQAILQGILSMGNRKVGQGLIYHLEDDLPFAKVWQKVGMDIDKFIFQEKALDVFFPWDMIEVEVKKSLLIREYRNVMRIASERR